VLDGSCRTPIAGHATFGPEGVRLIGQVLSPDGRRFFEGEETGADARWVGEALGRRIKAELPGDIFAVL
jgi:hydroxymethylbilane synthase